MKVSVVSGGFGGRFWGVGIGKVAKNRDIETYQLLRVDYHNVRTRHHMANTRFFTVEGRQFHWTVPPTPDEARD